MAKRYETGKSGSVYADGAKIPVTSWNVSGECDWQETTNSDSEGYHEDIPGTKKLTGSFEGSFDMDSKPVPNIEEGSQVQLILD